MTDTPETIEDARGLLCPIPVIRLAARMRAVATGQTVLLLATDTAAEEDVRLWCRGQGQEMVDVSRDGEVLRILVRRVR